MIFPFIIIFLLKKKKRRRKKEEIKQPFPSLLLLTFEGLVFLGLGSVSSHDAN
jgi:hypothetical protein